MRPDELKKDPTLQILQELKRKHGGINSIPDEELTKIGFVRYAPGSIRSIESNRRAIEAGKEGTSVTFEQKMEEKFKNAPFGEIIVGISVKESAGRRLDEKEIQLFFKKINGVINNLNHYEEEQNQKKKFYDFISFETDDPERNAWAKFILRRLTSLFIHSSLTQELADYSTKQFINNEGEIPSEKSEIIWRDLERMKGVNADTEEIERQFKLTIENTVVGSEMEEDFIDETTYMDYLARHKFDTVLESVMHLFLLQLRDENMDEVADGLEKATTLDQVRKFLKSNIQPMSEDIYKKESILKTRIKSAPDDEKRVMSKRLKEIKELKEGRLKTIKGLRDFFAFPEIASEILKRKLRELQDFLVRKTGAKGYDYDLVLVGTPDEELDKDPGKMSGDCTTGKPLPFEDPDFPVYNIKVFNKKREHIGNIYLLVTETEENAQKVWHLDAIQIPLDADWDTSVEKMFKSMGEKAEAKGVSFITVSDFTAHISNYDYIATAVENYAEEVNLGEIRVTIPKISSKALKVYSGLQGSGEDLIVWKNPDLISKIS